MCVCVCACFLKTYKLIDRYDDECLGGLSPPSLSLSHTTSNNTTRQKKKHTLSIIYIQRLRIVYNPGCQVNFEDET